MVITWSAKMGTFLGQQPANETQLIYSKDTAQGQVGDRSQTVERLLETDDKLLRHS